MFVEWTSARKPSAAARFPLSSVKKVVVGRQTRNFRRFSGDPGLTRGSFSIVYTNDQRREASLDLVAQNKADFLLWTKGLEKVIQLLLSCGKTVLQKTRAVLMEMPSSAAYVSYTKYWGS